MTRSLKFREGKACTSVWKHASTCVCVCMYKHSCARARACTHSHGHFPEGQNVAPLVLEEGWGQGRGQWLSAPEGSVVKKSPAGCFSFTRQLAVKAGQPDGEGLKCAQWVVIVQREHVVSHASELHDYVVSWKRKEMSPLEQQFPTCGWSHGSRVRQPHHDSKR